MAHQGAECHPWPGGVLQPGLCQQVHLAANLQPGFSAESQLCGLRLEWVEETTDSERLQSMKQKVVLITGCSSGIGLALAARIAKDEKKRFMGEFPGCSKRLERLEPSGSSRSWSWSVSLPGWASEGSPKCLRPSAGSALGLE